MWVSSQSLAFSRFCDSWESHSQSAAQWRWWNPALSSRSFSLFHHLLLISGIFLALFQCFPLGWCCCVFLQEWMESWKTLVSVLLLNSTVFHSSYWRFGRVCSAILLRSLNQASPTSSHFSCMSFWSLKPITNTIESFFNFRTGSHICWVEMSLCPLLCDSDDFSGSVASFRSYWLLKKGSRLMIVHDRFLVSVRSIRFKIPT